MKTVPLNELFEVTYGNKFDLRQMNQGKKEVAFVGRTAKNNGVVAFVETVEKEPYPAGLITVNLGGAILESFIQLYPFYTAQNVAVLKPRHIMTEKEKLYYCFAIYKNKFRYGAFGREANRTLRTLLVPHEVSNKFLRVDVQVPAIAPVLQKELSLQEKQQAWFTLDELFNIKKGKRLTKENMRPGETPFVGSTELDNGVTAYIDEEPIHQKNTISVTYNGSVAEAFYQPKDFWASDDVNVLYPKNFSLNPYIGLFLCSIIRKEKYRYNYGRKWHLERMRESKIKLPVGNDGHPDWQFMEDYIKSLPYSSAL